MATVIHPSPPDHLTTPATASVATPGDAESRDPATGELLRRYPAATREQVFAAAAAARAAQGEWAAQPLAIRVRMLRRFHETLYDRRREIAGALTRENGKPAAEALASEVATVLDFARYYAEQAPGFLRAPWAGAWSLGMKRKRVRVVREPFGVIGVISPWNYPFMLSAAIALPALVTGNAVLLKPSELTPTSGALLGELLLEAGLPRDLFAVLQGSGATGGALCDAPVDKIFFTGSVATGRKVAVACATRLIPCALELGGSDAAIVLADADLSHAASGIAWGRFSNAGQTCVAPKRVYVEAAVYDEFIGALGRVVRALRVGPGASVDTDVGPLIRPEAADRLRAQRDEAVGRGATAVASSLPEATTPRADGAPETRSGFFAPTVLLNVPADARVLHEETFGPLLPVVKVSDADEAVALANASEFGLAASIWSRDTQRAAALASRIDAGCVLVNDAIVAAGMPDVPHGGVKQSGIGRTHGIAGLEECVRTKATVTERFPGLPQPWWFGYGREHLAALEAFVELAHAANGFARLRAIPRLVRMLMAARRPR